ncbi:gluconokinase [Flexivirga caeni]|uniref:Sugar kinase n=1 Tax=Flexivirga caeni TaxID=2294115 RepID=A0A3M9LW36_9MICO|nr:gluconokinase [Flexivirga caeni]RNI17197.1 sugar kinase [Flexivirga caeni]
MTKGIDLADAVRPLVLALDVGSTATRGALYDARGCPIGKRVKLFHSFTSASDGTSVIDPDQVTDEIAQIIDALSAQVEAGGIGGVALDTFASSMVAVDAQGQALTPCYTYADGRCAGQVDQLRHDVDELALQQETGTRIHSSYWPARLRWLGQNQPDLHAAHYLSLGDYVYRRLLGVNGTGTAVAAWTGLVNRRTCDWDQKVAELSGITLSQLPPIRHPDQPFLGSELNAAATSRWPTLRDAVWFAPVADGLSANVGLGATDSTVMGATAATSGAMRVLVDALPERLPTGLWCYAVSRESWLLGGALNDVGRATDWLESNFHPDQMTDTALREALLADPVDGPMVLPFFTGERSTGWASDARGMFVGISAATTATQIYRAVVEGIALCYGRIATQLREVADQTQSISAGGRVTTARPELFQIVSDVIGVPIRTVEAKRSTLLGTAHLALGVLVPDVDRYQCAAGAQMEPVPARTEHYRQRLERFEVLYNMLTA